MDGFLCHSSHYFMNIYLGDHTPSPKLGSPASLCSTTRASFWGWTKDSSNSRFQATQSKNAQKKKMSGPKKESKVSIISSSWWLNQPLWKTWVKMGSSSPNGGENRKYLKLPPRFIIFQGLCQSTFCLVNYVFCSPCFFNGTLSWLQHLLLIAQGTIIDPLQESFTQPPSIQTAS